MDCYSCRATRLRFKGNSRGDNRRNLGRRGGELVLSRADFVWLIGSLCQLNRVPFDAALLVQRFPPRHSSRQLVEALQSLGFHTGDGVLAKAAFPCIPYLDGERPKPALRPTTHGAGVLY